MKYILLITFTIFIGCAQLMKGQEQPVVLQNAKEKIYYTTCSGAVENWGSCFDKASRTCPNGSRIMDKTENANGGFRTMTFRCFK